MASVYIGMAAVADFFDGFAARLLKVHSEMGKQLDSLADVVSFGVAPGMIIFFLSGQCFFEQGGGMCIGGCFATCINPYVALLIPVFSAIRLAKFNIDTRQSDSFIGVPTPANAIFIASIPFILQHDTLGLSGFFTNRYFLITFPFVSAYMLVAELPLLALKFKNFTWADNKARFILIAAALASVIAFGYTGIAIAIVLYVLISIIHNYINKSQSS